MVGEQLASVEADRETALQGEQTCAGNCYVHKDTCVFAYKLMHAYLDGPQRGSCNPHQFDTNMSNVEGSHSALLICSLEAELCPCQAQLDSFFDNWMHGGNGVTLTPNGMALAGSKGQLGNAGNAALLGLVYGRYSGGGDGLLRACWARRQVSHLSVSSPMTPFPYIPVLCCDLNTLRS